MLLLDCYYMQESPTLQHATSGPCVSPENIVDVSRHLSLHSSETVEQVSWAIELNHLHLPRLGHCVFTLLHMFVGLSASAGLRIYRGICY